MTVRQLASGRATKPWAYLVLLEGVLDRAEFEAIGVGGAPAVMDHHQPRAPRWDDQLWPPPPPPSHVPRAIMADRK